jgi:short-subunit dehydrogenase
MKFKDRLVLITGGTSGIGRIMARMAFERGARKVVVWGTSQRKIDDTVAEFSAKGYDIAGYSVDVSDAKAVEMAAINLRATHGEVDILINNAGVVTSNRTFDGYSVEEINRTMDINSKAPMYVALQLLPQMVKRNSGHICNIASAAGMIANPRMSVYVASKWAVIGWSESMRIELKQQRSDVHVTTVAPYYINTGMFDGVKSPILPILEPEATARTIIRAIERNKDFKGIPLGFHLIRLAQGLLPTSWFEFIFGRCFGIFSTMDNFTGRKK